MVLQSTAEATNGRRDPHRHPESLTRQPDHGLPRQVCFAREGHRRPTGPFVGATADYLRILRTGCREAIDTRR